jgi:hypothetical protein
MLSTDPNDWLLDKITHDLVIVDGDFAFSSGGDGVAQDIKIAVKMVMGEWFADLADGIPYWERVGVPASQALLGSKFNKARYEQVFRARIIKIPGVDTVDEVVASFDSSTRTSTVAWSVTTIFDDTITGSITQ